MLTIIPYKEGNVWYFDDERVGVKHEPFVGDVNLMIDRMVRDAKIARPEWGFLATFSERQFPGATMVMRKTQAPKFDADCAVWPDQDRQPEAGDYGGAWYKAYGLTGWLCPVLNRYFQSPPAAIYVKAEARPKMGLFQAVLTYVSNWMERNSIELP